MTKENMVQTFMEKELEALKHAIDTVDSSTVEALVSKILTSEGRVIFTGVGKSGHIGKKLAATFASTGTPSFFMHATEALHGDLGMITANDVVIAISNSGSTKEVLSIYPSLRKIGCYVVAITGNNKSEMAKKSDLAIELNVESEADELGLAPTNSSTVALAFGDAVAMTLSYRKGFGEEDFAVFHPGGALGKKLLGVEVDV